MTDFIARLSEIASIATAIGVLVAGWQLVLSKRLASMQFEDDMAAQYRELIRRIPVGALLGEEISEEDYRGALPAFYHYFDLSNEQAFLHERGRIAHSTWNEWRSGIHQNLARPAFLKAWNEVSTRAPDSFDELRRVLAVVQRSGANATTVNHAR
jgi:hypothetical protein